MHPLAETTAVVGAALAGAAAGWACSRRPGRWWLAGYLASLVVVALIAASRRIPELGFVPPFSWLMAGRTEFAALAWAGPMMLTTPLSRLRSRAIRAFVCLFMVAVVGLYSVAPFLMPYFARPELENLSNRLDHDGVCIQGTPYTCGPAAAVTALRSLGFEAREGRLAILARSSGTAGTAPDVLAEVLRREYGPAGLQCEYRRFRSIDELRAYPVTLVVTKYSLLTDHYLTVLGVTDDTVVTGDPSLGKETYRRAEFAGLWRFTGIGLSRREAPGRERRFRAGPDPGPDPGPPTTTASAGA